MKTYLIPPKAIAACLWLLLLGSATYSTCHSSQKQAELPPQPKVRPGETHLYTQQHILLETDSLAK